MWNDYEVDREDMEEIEARLYSQIHYCSNETEKDQAVEVTPTILKKSSNPYVVNNLQSTPGGTRYYDNAPINIPYIINTPNESTDQVKDFPTIPLQNKIASNDYSNENSGTNLHSYNFASPQSKPRVNKYTRRKRMANMRNRIENLKVVPITKENTNTVKLTNRKLKKIRRLRPKMRKKSANAETSTNKIPKSSIQSNQSNEAIVLSASEDDDPEGCLLIEDKFDVVSLSSDTSNYDNRMKLNELADDNGTDDVIFVQTEEEQVESICLDSDHEKDDKDLMKPPSDPERASTSSSNAKEVSTPPKQQSMNSDRLKEIISTPESSNDFLDNSLIQQGKDNFNFSLHGSSFESCFAKPKSLNELYESESSCSASDTSTPVKIGVFNDVSFETPTKQSFSDKDIDSFGDFITPKRYAGVSVPSILTSIDSPKKSAKKLPENTSDSTAHDSFKNLPDLSYFSNDSVLDTSKTDALSKKTSKRKSVDKSADDDAGSTKKKKLSELEEKIKTRMTGRKSFKNKFDFIQTTDEQDAIVPSTSSPTKVVKKLKAVKSDVEGKIVKARRGSDSEGKSGKGSDTEGKSIKSGKSSDVEGKSGKSGKNSDTEGKSTKSVKSNVESKKSNSGGESKSDLEKSSKSPRGNTKIKTIKPAKVEKYNKDTKDTNSDGKSTKSNNSNENESVVFLPNYIALKLGKKNDTPVKTTKKIKVPKSDGKVTKVKVVKKKKVDASTSINKLLNEDTKKQLNKRKFDDVDALIRDVRNEIVVVKKTKRRKSNEFAINSSVLQDDSLLIDEGIDEAEKKEIIESGLYEFSDIEEISDTQPEIIEIDDNDKYNAKIVQVHYEYNSDSDTSSRYNVNIDNISRDLVLSTVDESIKDKIDWNTFEVRDIQALQSNNPNMWKINDADKNYRFVRERGPRCLRCREFGHVLYKCKLPPQPLKCRLCGIRGHLEPTCRNKVCTQCGCSGAFSTTYCPNCVHIARKLCNLCKVRGHIVGDCPDLWRRYHLTTEEGPIVKANKIVINSAQWCSLCSKSGHFSHNCRSLYTRHYSPSIPFIINYDELYNFENELPKSPACSKNTKTNVKKDIIQTQASNSNDNQLKNDLICESNQSIDKTCVNDRKTVDDRESNQEMQNIQIKIENPDEFLQPSTSTIQISEIIASGNVEIKSEIVDTDQLKEVNIEALNDSKTTEDQSINKQTCDDQIATTSSNLEATATQITAKQKRALEKFGVKDTNRYIQIIDQFRLSNATSQVSNKQKVIAKMFANHETDSCRLCQAIEEVKKKPDVETVTDIIQLTDSDFNMLTKSGSGKKLMIILEGMFNVSTNLLNLDNLDYLHITGTLEKIDNIKAIFPFILKNLKTQQSKVEILVNALGLVYGVKKVCPISLYKELIERQSESSAKICIKLNIMLFVIFGRDDGKRKLNELNKLLSSPNLVAYKNRQITKRICTFLYQMRSYDFYNATIASILSYLPKTQRLDENRIEDVLIIPLYADMFEMAEGQELIKNLPTSVFVSYKYMRGSLRLGAEVTLLGTKLAVQKAKLDIMTAMSNLDLIKSNPVSLSKYIAMQLAKITVLYYSTTSNELYESIQELGKELSDSSYQMKQTFWKLHALLMGNYKLFNGRSAMNTLSAYKQENQLIAAWKKNPNIISTIIDAFNVVFNPNRIPDFNYTENCVTLPAFSDKGKENFDESTVRRLIKSYKEKCVQLKLYSEIEQLNAFENCIDDNPMVSHYLVTTTMFLRVIQRQLQ